MEGVGDLSLCARTGRLEEKGGEWGKDEGAGEKLDDLPGEGFPELDPAVLALEQADEHVLLRPATFQFPDFRRLWNVSTALWTDYIVELGWRSQAHLGEVRRGRHDGRGLPTCEAW